MDRFTKPRLEHIKGDTWCIVTGSCRIPLYMPDKSDAVMIDSGLKSPDRYPILAVLEQKNIRVTSLLTSHFHRDHIGNHRVIKEKFDAHVYMTPFTSAICDNNKTTVLYETSMLAILRGGPVKCDPDTVFEYVDGDLNVKGCNFHRITLPGHAQEHIGFVTPDGIAYLGDTILSRDILHAVRIPYCTFCGEDLQSKAKARDLTYSGYIMAHNCFCDSIKELAQENIDNMHEKINMVESLINQPITLEALAAKVMEHTCVDTNSLIKVLGAKRNVQVVVEYLQETGRVDLQANNGYIEYVKTT